MSVGAITKKTRQDILYVVILRVIAVDTTPLQKTLCFHHGLSFAVLQKIQIHHTVHLTRQVAVTMIVQQIVVEKKAVGGPISVAIPATLPGMTPINGIDRRQRVSSDVPILRVNKNNYMDG